MQPQQPREPQEPGEARRQGQPVEGFMRTALDSIKAMVDVNTILGVPVQAPDGTVIIPVSRVSFGFVAGGSEFDSDTSTQPRQAFPFGGATGAGVSLSPVAFLVVHQGQVRLLPVSERALYDRLLDLLPWLAERMRVGQDGRGRPAGAAEALASRPLAAAERAGDGQAGSPASGPPGGGSQGAARSSGPPPLQRFE